MLAAAAALRLWALDTQPGGLYPDEAAEAYDAHRLLHEPGFHPVFFQDDAGREALYGYLVAVAFRVAGESVPVLRGTSAVIGVVGVALLYLWLRRRGQVVALGAAAWAAGSLWLVCVSRDGMRNILVFPACVAAMWALDRWGRAPGRLAAVVAGGALGLGLWTYQPLKLLPLAVAGWLLWRRRVAAPEWPRLRAGLPWLLIGFVLVGGPMLATAVTQPGLYFGRAAGVAAAGGTAGPVGVVDHVVRTLLMFAVTGDPNERHNVGGTPLLGWPLTVVAALGVYAAWRRRGEALESLVLVMVAAMMVPPLLGFADAAPHFLRSIGLAAPLGALIGLGSEEALRLGRSRGPRPGLVAGGIVAVLLVAGAVLGAQAYFSRPLMPRYAAYSGNVVQLAEAVRIAPPGTTVLVDPYQALDLLFLDRGALARPDGPTIRDPAGGRVQPGGGCSVLALTRSDITRAYGDAVAQEARAVAADPQGKISVWLATCP